MENLSLLPWKRWEKWWYKYWGPLNEKKMYFVITDLMTVYDSILDEFEIQRGIKKYLPDFDDFSTADVLSHFDNVLNNRRFSPNPFVRVLDDLTVEFTVTSQVDSSGSYESSTALGWGFECMKLSDSSEYIKREVIEPMAAILSNFDDEGNRENLKKRYDTTMEYGAIITEQQKAYFEKIRTVVEVRRPVENVRERVVEETDEYVETEAEKTRKRKLEAELEEKRKKMTKKAEAKKIKNRL
jgi:hypothetical protein